MDLRTLIFNFFFFLSAGTFLSMGFLKQTKVGRNYFLYHAGGAGFLALLNYVVIGKTCLTRDAGLWYLGFTALSILFAFTVTKYRSVSVLSYFLGALFVLGALLVHCNDTAPPLQAFSYTLNALFSLLLLGFTLNSMMLGHWYLIQPDLPIAELKRLCLIMLTLMSVRLIYSFIPLQAVLTGKTEMEIYSYFLSTTSGVFLLMRFTWGIIAPLVFGFLIWNTVKISSTQSATGILYVAVLSVITGEILSLYLAQYHGISL